MFFHRSLSRDKSQLVPRTLLSILDDFSYAVVWMVSARPLIHNSSSSLSKPLGTVPSAPLTFGITVTFMFQSFFRSLAVSKNLFLFSFSLISTLWSAGMQGFVLVNYHQIWSSVWNLEFCLHLKIPENFLRLILQDGFWFVYIPFGSMVKFLFIAQFPVNHLLHPVVSSLILPLRYFATFADYAIGRFVSITI